MFKWKATPSYFKKTQNLNVLSPKIFFSRTCTWPPQEITKPVFKRKFTVKWDASLFKSWPHQTNNETTYILQFYIGRYGGNQFSSLIRTMHEEVTICCACDIHILFSLYNLFCWVRVCFRKKMSSWYWLLFLQDNNLDFWTWSEVEVNQCGSFGGLSPREHRDFLCHSCKPNRGSNNWTKK